MTRPTPERIAGIRADMERCPELWSQSAFDLLAEIDAITAEREAALALVAAAMREALIWCSGSGDFAPGGKAHEGWKKVVESILYPDASKATEEAAEAPKPESAEGA